MNSPQHRSRKEKLICRSIVTSELVVPEDENGPSDHILLRPNSTRSSDSDLQPANTPNNSFNSHKVNCTSTPLKAPSKTPNPNSNATTLPRTLKLKSPRKQKQKNCTPKISLSSSPPKPTLPSAAPPESPSPTGNPSPTVTPLPFPTTNGTDLNHYNVLNPSPTGTSLKVQLPISKKIKVHIPPSICADRNGGSPTTTTPTPTNSNGLINNFSPVSTGSDKKPLKIRKPRKRKGDHLEPVEIPRVKRKYTKRKFKMPRNESQPSPYPFHPQRYNYKPGASPNLLDELNRIPTEYFNREIEFRGSVSPSSSIPSQESSPSRSEKKVVTRVDYHAHDSDELETSSTADEGDGAEVEVTSTRESLSIPNNTHLLLSPVTLKRMLRTPSPSITPSQVPTVEDEVDEELMCDSNSLFRDLSINRQLKTPSPNGSQYGGSLSSSNGTNTSPSPTGGRLRYSRRRFGRLYPPYDISRCYHEECTEKPLLGARFCGLHMESSSTPIYGLCQYTEPNSLKPCSQFTVGHDDREFRFCDAHGSRIATTRIRMSRLNRNVENYQSVKDEIKKNLEVTMEDHLNNTTPTPRSPQVPANSESLDDPKEELSSEFNKEIDIPLPQHGRTFKHFAKFQPDYESDEDVMDTDEHDPLGRAGYYSTDEVISIYRSKLEKLKNLYIGQFSSLKNAYMEFRVRHLAEKDKNEGISFTYTSNPKHISVKNPTIPPDFREQQMAERDKALRLIRYRHQKGERAVVHRQAKALYQANKTEALENRKISPLGEIIEDMAKSTYESDSDDEVASPYQFLQTLTKREAQKREAWISNFNSDSSNAIKGSLASSSSSTNQKVCAYLSTESGSVRCPNQAVPCSEYCQNHILSESSQVLFSTCNRPLSDGQESCKTPLIRSLDRFGCMIHRLAQVKKYREPEDIKLKRRKLINELPKAELEEEKDVLENLIAKETFTMSHFDEAVRRISLSTDLVDTDDSDEEESDGDGQAGTDGPFPHTNTTEMEQNETIEEITIKEEVEDPSTPTTEEDSNSEDHCPL